MIKMIEFLAMGLFLLAPNTGQAAEANLNVSVTIVKEVVECGPPIDALDTCTANPESPCCAIASPEYFDNIEPAAGDDSDVSTTQSCEVWIQGEALYPVCVTNFE